MPRYVILYHETPEGGERPSHWDLMLEFEGTLATWALAKPLAVGSSIPAERLADHRLAYLDYEGPISGGRGSVARWDHGEFSLSANDTDGWALELRGGKLEGRLTLCRESGVGNCWLARLHT